MLESLICDKTGGGKMKKDIKEHVSKIETFHKESFFWEYLINFGKSLKVRANLSTLSQYKFYCFHSCHFHPHFHWNINLPLIH